MHRAQDDTQEGKESVEIGKHDGFISVVTLSCRSAKCYH